MKFKGQNPKSERKKSEAAVCSIQQALWCRRPFKASMCLRAKPSFGFRISFGFRYLVFGFAPT
jgi:ubiquitin